MPIKLKLMLEYTSARAYSGVQGISMRIGSSFVTSCARISLCMSAVKAKLLKAKFFTPLWRLRESDETRNGLRCRWKVKEAQTRPPPLTRADIISDSSEGGGGGAERPATTPSSERDK